MALLINREYHVEGNWYAPLRRLEQFDSVIHVEHTDTTSSAGDWSGFLIQKTGNKLFAIAFTQENNFPRSGFTIKTDDQWFYSVSNINMITIEKKEKMFQRIRGVACNYLYEGADISQR